ncbi:MAG TPA: cytochrome c biogenesis CcdA family protein [Stellaceae bacterium]|nr:cytochrome c biogenesis CcdA family protein [Stellaceae bacterium]
MLDIALALLAGILTIAAPCVLPMLPILFGVSVGQTSGTRPIFITLGFTLTFSLAALVFGSFTEVLGLSAEALREAAVGLLLVFGGLMVWRRPFERIAARMSTVLNRVDTIGGRAGSGNLGGLVLGMTLGVVWTPCAGPVLGSILTLIGTSRQLGWAALLLVCYALGAGIPMLVIAYGGQYVGGRVRCVARYALPLQRGFGVVVMLIAIAIHYQVDALVTARLSAFFPSLPQGL